MNWLDITILVLLGIGGLLGLKSGLLWQVARLVIFGVSVYVTIYYHGPMADFLKANLTAADEGVLIGLSYFFTFIATYVVLYLGTMLIERAVRAMKLKWMDRLLGAGLGMLKAALICAVLLLGVVLVPIKAMQPDIDNSYLAPPLLVGVRGMSLLIPEEQKQRVTAWFDEKKDQAEKKVEEKVKEKVKEEIRERVSTKAKEPERATTKAKEPERDPVEEAVLRALEGSKENKGDKKK